MELEMVSKKHGRRRILYLIAILLIGGLVYRFGMQSHQSFNGVLLWGVQTYLPSQWFSGLTGVRIGQGKGIYRSPFDTYETSQIFGLETDSHCEILPTGSSSIVLVRIAQTSITLPLDRWILIDRSGKLGEILAPQSQIVGADLPNRIVFLQDGNELYQAPVIKKEALWEIQESAKRRVWRSPIPFRYRGGSHNVVLEEPGYIRIVDLYTGKVRDEFVGENIVCYSDSKMAYLHEGWIVIYTIKTKQHIRIIEIPKYEELAGWSPDGKHILSITSTIDFKRVLVEVQTLQIRDSTNGRMLWRNSEGGWNIMGAAWVL